MPRKVLIVGGVAGGATAATRLRRIDEEAEIILFERGEYISFANCGLPYYIGDIIPTRDALIVQEVEDLKQKFAIDVRTFQEVITLDPNKKIVHVQNLKTNETYEESYDYIILSTGAAPIKPPIPGLKEATNLFTLRTIPDTDAIKKFIQTNKPKRASVIGGGFIGIEMAENLHHLGLHVTLIEMAKQIMAPIDYEMAVLLHAHLLEKGVDLILEDGVKSFQNQGASILLNSGKEVDADIIIFAIGVRPENKLAKDAGLALGSRGGIQVNEYLQTSDPFVYAIGDAIEVADFVSHNQTMIPLAGPANKQGRIAADNIVGRGERYLGAMGTAVAKVFDLVVGATGNNEKTLQALGFPYQAIHIHPLSHAGYYPGSSSIAMKLLYSPVTEEILGAQAVGMEGVDKRIDVLSTAIASHLRVTDLKNLELSYAPPFSSAKDPVNMLGFVADNIIYNLVSTFQWHEVDSLLQEKAFFLDVRDPIEIEMGAIETAKSIPYTELRQHLAELPKDQTIHVYCQSGVRAYSACRILMQHGFDVKNLDGGYKTYQCVYRPNEAVGCVGTIDEFGVLEMEEKQEQQTATIEVNACGLQCPGPIIQVYKAMENAAVGDVIAVKATDMGFATDIKAWCAKSGHLLLSLTNENKVLTALIKKQTKSLANNKDIAVSQSKDNTTIVVFSQDLDKAIAAFIIASGAASMGKKVSLFFTFWGLNILRRPKRVRVKKTGIEKMFGRMMPRGVNKLPISNMNMLGMGPKMIRSIMKKKNVDSLAVLMQQAFDLGIKIVACAMSMDIMGIKKEELIDGVSIGGVATYLADTTEANHNLFI